MVQKRAEALLDLGARTPATCSDLSSRSESDIIYMAVLVLSGLLWYWGPVMECS